MTTGERNLGRPDRQHLDVDRGGRSAGRPAAGELEGGSFNPLGNPGTHHWQAGYISDDSLDERGNIFFAATEMTRMPMALTDPRRPDNPIVFANKAFLDMTGYEVDDVVGRNCRLLQGPDTNPHTVAEVREAIAEQRAVAVDILNYKADGSPFWNALFIGPVFSGDGELLYFFSSQVDISERRLNEQSTMQAQKLEAIGQLTAGMAHDFNNLLQVISGNIEVAEALGRDDPKLTATLQRAQQAAGRGGKLIQQLLTFARKQRLEPRRLNLNARVVEFSELLVRTLGKNVELRLDLRPDIPACMVDPTHLEMALLNVLINARDAMPTGGTVTVGTTVVEVQERDPRYPDLAAGIYAALSVTDEGMGMPPAVAQRATEPFFTTKAPGTGLGLAMVHGFLLQSQGRLRIDSEPDRGTTVELLFPAALQPELPRIPKSGSEINATQARTVLVVEDSADVRMLTETWLEGIGNRVLSAASGEEALKLLDKHPHIDLLFTDLIMPGGMNGLALAEEVRRRLPRVPVIVATGYMDELAQQGAQHETFITMSKPFRRTELEQQVRSAFDRRKSR